MPERLDQSPWRPVHTRIALALGFGWMLDAFEVQIIGSVVPGIQQEFGLSTSQAVLINVVWFAGIALGALLFGYLADRFGRRRLFTATLILYSLAALATAASPNYELFMVFRFVTALGVGGEYSAVTSAIAEFMPARSRGRTNALVMCFWAVGGVLAGVVSLVVISGLDLSWRYTLLFGVVSAGYGVVARRFIPESPRWLIARGRYEEADRAIVEITGLRGGRETNTAAVAQMSLRTRLGLLWRHYRGRTLFGMSLDFSEAAGYYGLFTAMSIFVFSSASGAVPIGDGTLPYYFIVANFGALLGGLFVAWGLDRFGRKPTVTLSYLGASLSMFVCAWGASTGSPTVVLVAFTIAAFAATCAWISAYPTFSELFPTRLRATGIGVSVGFGRMGAIVGQILLAQTAGAFRLGSIFTLLAAFWLIGAVAGLVWWIRGVEARGVSLETLTVGDQRQ